MTAPNTTPGPWHIFASSYAAERKCVEVNDPSGLTVAWAQTFVPAYRAQSDANAHLIASAPELYEALAKAPIIGGTESAIGFRDRQDRWLREVYNPAMAKARGEAA